MRIHRLNPSNLSIPTVYKSAYPNISHRFKTIRSRYQISVGLHFP